MDSIKVFNNLSDENLHFESKEEFDRYYKKNKEIIDKMSTRALNMKISIDGYKLGRLKKELTLFPTDTALGKRLGSIHNSEQNIEDSFRFHNLNLGIIVSMCFLLMNQPIVT